MRSRHAVALAVAVGVLGLPAGLAGQVPKDSAARAIAALAARVDSLEAGLCPAGPPIQVPEGNDSVSVALRRLADRIDHATATRCTAGGGAPQPEADELAALRASADSTAGTPPGAPKDSTAPVQFESRQRNGAALNPEISATGDIRLRARDASPQRNNGNLREVEVGIQSALDPYSYAKLFLSFENDEVGVEEGYLYWTGLPGRLRLDVGKFREQVGDLNRWHLHALPETDYPLVYQRYFGSEGLDGVGLSLYTSLPFSLAGATHEVWLQGTTAESRGLSADARQPTLLGRLQNFWQLSRSSYAQIGVTGAGANNADSALKGRLIGMDFRFTWRPPNAGTRQNLTLRAEGYRMHTVLAGVRTSRYGGFADLNYQASRRWTVGARGDWVEAPRGASETEWQLTPTLTWWQSEFVFLRLEGQHHHSDVTGNENRVILQAVFAMGPHKHETY